MVKPDVASIIAGVLVGVLLTEHIKIEISKLALLPPPLIVILIIGFWFFRGKIRIPAEISAGIMLWIGLRGSIVPA